MKGLVKIFLVFLETLLKLKNVEGFVLAWYAAVT
jgi:hypothetical protein